MSTLSESRDAMARATFRAGTRLQTWMVYGPILLVAALLRLVNLGGIKTLVFDEIYYVRDAWTVWNLGYEAQWEETADFAAGDVTGYRVDGSFIAHPPLGKWIIALGMAPFGPTNPFGWRFATAIAGIVVVLLVMLIARRLFNSVALAGLAGSLVAIDGIAITMSRTALLDGILAAFILGGFLAVLKHLDTPRWGGWLLLAGALLGAAMAVKWSGLYALAVFGLWVVATETLRIRRAANGGSWFGSSFLNAVKSFALLVPVSGAVYLASWSGWILTKRGWGRTWAIANDLGTGVWGTIRSLWKYHRDIYDYNVNLRDPHSYSANPFSWLGMIRPTAFYYEKLDDHGTVGYVTSIANPVIWYAAVLALVIVLIVAIRKPSWNVIAILVGIVATYVPWLFFSERTVFQFYTVTIEPFLVLTLVWVLGWAWRHRMKLVVVNFLIIALAVSAFFLPAWTGWPIPDWFAAAHYWFPSWI